VGQLGAVHERRIGQHAVLLELDNPPANALGGAMRKFLLAKLEALESDFSVRAVALTGRGNAFCSGDDLKEQEAAQRAGVDARKEQLAEFARVLDRIEAFRAPVIGAINGWCIGGGLELALVCDIRIASSAARFTAAGANIGLLASAYRLPRLIGVARAKQMLFTGSPVDAANAERFGLVTALHDPGELETAACVLAERIASRAPLSVEAAKRVASRAADLIPAEAAKSTAKELTALVKSADHAEALAAFREKRDPKFERR
jgi:enoyl-CoA hydratase